MKKGYVKLYRKLSTESVWNDPLKLRLLLQCLMKAAYKEEKVTIENQVIDLNIGQFVTGRESLTKEFNLGLQTKYQVSDKTIWRWLKVLETSGLLEINSTNKYSIVTVKNDISDTNIEQKFTKNGTSNVQQMTTKKNYKNNKEYNNTRSLDRVNDLLNTYMEDE